MYQVGGWLDFLWPKGLLRNTRSGAGRVPANVLFLGLTSLWTDISSEMVVSVLPLYLVTFLHLSPVQFGIIDGLYQGVGALVQLASAALTDRWQRYKEVAAFGYAVSAACRIGMLMTTVWTGITTLLVFDRFGKGIRTAPRDALISLSVDAEQLGTAFGVHRAMDAMGAMLGPVVAFALLSLVPGAFDAVFMASFCAALIGLAVLGFFVENRRPDQRAPSSAAAGPDFALVSALFRARNFRHLTICAFVLGAMTVSDAFVYLTLQREMNISSGAFPLLYVLTALAYLSLAVPAGRVADRIGRFRVFIGGHVLLLALYGVLLTFPAGKALVAVSLFLLGAYYAATEGVLMALGSVILPESSRTSGLAVLTTATAIARLGGSVFFGLAWTRYGLEMTLVIFLIGLLAAIVAATMTRPQPALVDR